VHRNLHQDAPWWGEWVVEWVADGRLNRSKNNNSECNTYIGAAACGELRAKVANARLPGCINLYC